MFRTAKLSQLDEFDEIIDVRTPAEFDEDHIPGAINCPVLTNEERVIVGTLYKQKSPFEARKVGAVMVARNVADHVESQFSLYPKSWKPLIYCWRGGQRSGAMTIILNQVGWSAQRLEGGYKGYRREVLDALPTLSQKLKLRVICGPTGSGKSRLLKVLKNNGHQVLDLENLAKHCGSVLGNWPDQVQPSQKWFESLLLQMLKTFDITRPIFIEAESNKIGRIALPESLVSCMHNSECIVLGTTIYARVAGLLDDYQHYLNDPNLLIDHLQSLNRYHGAKKLEQWTALIHNGDYAKLVEELLILHYDPSYSRSTSKHYINLSKALHVTIVELNENELLKVVGNFQRET